MFSKTVSSRDAAPEPTGMYSRRVLGNMSVSCTVSEPRRNIYLVFTTGSGIESPNPTSQKLNGNRRLQDIKSSVE